MTKIFLLGELKIIENNAELLRNVLSNKDKAAVLEYLILNGGKKIEIDDLAKIVPGEEHFKKTRKETIRLLNALKQDLAQESFKDCFEITGNTCMWKKCENIVLDIDILKDLCDVVTNAKILNEDIANAAENLILSYTDDLLKRSKNADLYHKNRLSVREQYISSLKNYILLLSKSEKYVDVARVCKLALESLPLDKHFIVCFMSALVKIDREKEAINYYKNIVNLFDKYMGTKPPKEITDFYAEIMQKQRGNEIDAQYLLTDLRENLDTSHKESILVCDYSVFKDIYRLYMRNFTRLKIDMHLALITVTTSGGENQVFEAENAMKRLLDILKSHLRKGDTVSRHSAMRYVVLLPNTPGFKEGRMVLERIKHTFYKEADNALFKLTYKILSVNENNENMKLLNLD